MAKCVFGGKVWRGEVVIPGCNKHLHVRVATHRLPEVHAGIRVLIPFAPIPFCIGTTEDLIAAICLETKNLTAIPIERGRVRWSNRGHRWIILRAIRCPAAFLTHNSAVETPYDDSIGAAKLFTELPNVDAEIRKLKIFGAKPSEADQLAENLCAYRGRDAIPLHQCGCIVTNRKCFRLPDDLLDRFTEEGAVQLAVVPGGCSICRQEQNVRQVIAICKGQCLEVQDSRDENEAAERDPHVH